MENNRPKRVVVRDFAGRLLSLSEGFQSLRLLFSAEEVFFVPKNPPILLLGLGGGVMQLPKEYANRPVFWCEAQQILQETEAQKKIPSDWMRLSEAQVEELFTRCLVFWQPQGARLAPSFWMRLLGRCFAKVFRQMKRDVRDGRGQKKVQLFLGGKDCLTEEKALQPSQAPKTVLLFGSAKELLHNELLWAFEDLGWQVVLAEDVARDAQPEYALAQRLWGRAPTCAIAVNGHGFDAEGRIFGLLQAMHVPVALWFVDNPWHVLTSMALPWWKEATLFVTDPSHIPQLQRHGAKEVHFLPLASCPRLWRELSEEKPCFPPLFVGRSEFPSKARYFAAVHINEELLSAAEKLLLANGSPDFHWWQHTLKVTTLWPGNNVRMAGAGAEALSQKKRILWLTHAVQAGVEIVGDAGWRNLVPKATVHPPIDYYTELFDWYAKAPFVLNVTSLQLPQSLSQRHFDVWAAGGFLLSDPTPGLDLFPRELVAPCRMARPEDLWDVMSTLLAKKGSMEALKKEWRSLLREAHTYTHRVMTLLGILLGQ